MAMDIIGEMYMLPLANSIIGSQLCLTCLINSALAKNPPNSSAYLPNEMSHFASWLANCEKKVINYLLCRDDAKRYVLQCADCMYVDLRFLKLFLNRTTVLHLATWNKYVIL